MPVLVLLALALLAGTLAGLVAWRYPRMRKGPDLTPADAARVVGEHVARHSRLRTFRDARLDPAAATGLALTLALLLAIGGGVLLGVLAYLVRANGHLVGIDNGVAKWGNRHATTTSTHVLNAITQLGGIYLIVASCIVLALAETIRERTVWVTAFIIAAVGGEELLTTTVKQLANRVRPTFNPAAAHLGPSFPSGHSATAAVFYATAALLIGRWRARPARAILAGCAVGIAVAVASSRVLLDVHWVSDVIAGLALGWAWFSVCAIAFGGRILRFGAAAETAVRAADAASPVGVPSSNGQGVRRGVSGRGAPRRARARR
jgi:membrane-associated phospholipid phosphatase